jgi:transposase-like protein
MIALACPHCGETRPVVKRGYNACKHTFTLNTRPTTLTPASEELILAHLRERTSIRGICHVVGCSPNTVYTILE